MSRRPARQTRPAVAPSLDTSTPDLARECNAGDPPREGHPSTVAAVVARLAWRKKEVARALGISERAFERERSAGRFPRPDLTIGRMPLWRPETIRAWIDGQADGRAVSR